MLSNFFSKSKPITSIILLSLFIVYFLLATFNSKLTDFYIDKNILNYGWYWLLILLTFFFFNFVVAKNELTFDNSYAFLFFIILLGLVPVTFSDEKVVAINLSLLLFLRKIYSLHSLKKIIQKLFDAGFWLGISFLIEPYMAIFAIFIYAGAYSFLKINLQTITVPILGWIAPVFLYFSYCFWYDKLDVFYNLFYWTSTYDFSIYNSLVFILPSVLVAVFLLPSLLFKSSSLSGKKNTFKSNWYLVLLNLILALIIVILVNNKTGSEWLYTFFPIAVILANGLELVKKSLVKDIIISVFLLSSVVLLFL